MSRPRSEIRADLHETHRQRRRVQARASRARERLEAARRSGCSRTELAALEAGLLRLKREARELEVEARRLELEFLGGWDPPAWGPDAA